ncbi:MAG: sigma 54-interacting transcriptional regulator [bacterium]
MDAPPRLRRADAPFLAVNMACLPGELVESELFGHVRGPSRGPTAPSRASSPRSGRGRSSSTRWELPLAHQAKPLRVLETRTFRAVGDTREQTFRGRLVAATHRDLRREVLDGRFREDLFYRLQVLPLELPPLRHRREDILPIVHHWLGRVGSTALAVAPDAEALLLAHDWPGNVREVVNLARRVALFAEGAGDRRARPPDAGRQPLRAGLPAERGAPGDPRGRGGGRNLAGGAGASPHPRAPRPPQERDPRRPHPRNQPPDFAAKAQGGASSTTT